MMYLAFLAAIRSGYYSCITTRWQLCFDGPTVSDHL